MPSVLLSESKTFSQSIGRSILVTSLTCCSCFLRSSSSFRFFSSSFLLRSASFSSAFTLFCSFWSVLIRLPKSFDDSFPLSLNKSIHSSRGSFVEKFKPILIDTSPSICVLDYTKSCVRFLGH